MKIFETQNPPYSISTDKRKLNTELIHKYLSEESYWAKNIPLAIVEKSIEGSVCFGVYENEIQIGFARVITDNATYGYLADVFILPQFHGRGLGTWLMKEIMTCPFLQGFRGWMLATKDAHALYEKFGFERLINNERFMKYNPR